MRERTKLDSAIAIIKRLRAAIAALYETATPEAVLVAHGAIGANHLVYAALVEPGGVVVSVVPTYQQHTAIPASLGAEVRQVALREAEGWRLDLDCRWRPDLERCWRPRIGRLRLLRPPTLGCWRVDRNHGRRLAPHPVVWTRRQ